MMNCSHHHESFSLGDDVFFDSSSSLWCRILVCSSIDLEVASVDDFAVSLLGLFKHELFAVLLELILDLIHDANQE